MLSGLQGYRTYTIAIVGAALTAYTTLSPTFGWPAIPESILQILGFLGLASLRAAVPSK